MGDSRPVATQRISQIPAAADPAHAALVTVVRDTGSFGAAGSAALRLNGKPVASFRVREALTFSLNPGEYVFALQPVPDLGAGVKEYSLTAKAGEHYYYRISVASEGFLLQRSFEVAH
jgi:hypothetical protein